MQRAGNHFGPYRPSVAHAGDDCPIAMPRRLEDGAWGLATGVARQHKDDRSQIFGQGLAAGKSIDGRFLTTKLFALCLSENTYALDHQPRFVVICSELVWPSETFTALL